MAAPGEDVATNVLLLLHGLGDKKESFARLGQQMQLPETVCIAIEAPNTLLDLDGRHWGDDIIFDTSNGGLDADSGLKAATELLKIIINETLIDKCQYQAREIVIFGYGQGGMVGLSTARELQRLFDVELWMLTRSSRSSRRCYRAKAW